MRFPVLLKAMGKMWMCGCDEWQNTDIAMCDNYSQTLLCTQVPLASLISRIDSRSHVDVVRV